MSAPCRLRERLGLALARRASLVLCLVVGALVGCSSPQAPPSQIVPLKPLPDFIDLGDNRLDAEVWTRPEELSRPVFEDLHGRPRLLVYAYPGVERLALPVGGPAHDVVFFDLGGRAIEVYPQAQCQAQDAPCDPLPSRFPAMTVLIAPPGLLDTVGFDRADQMRWGGHERPVPALGNAGDP